MTKTSSGLLLAIVPAVAIYWLTLGFPWSPKKPSNPASQSFDGRVIDATSQRLLSGAAVILDLAGVATIDTTDSEGRYLFNLAQPATPVAAVLTVRAQGYQDYVLNIGPDLPQPLPDIPLQPSPPQSSPHPASAPKVSATNLVARVPYLRRTTAIQVKLPQK